MDFTFTHHRRYEMRETGKNNGEKKVYHETETNGHPPERTGILIENLPE
jgi:hypothetical protein